MKIFKKPIFVSVSPNAQKDDVWLALKLLFSPWKWTGGKATGKFREEFKNYLGVKNVFTFDSGRTSLWAVLKAFELEKGDEILVQAFTCTAAVNPILWVGAKPVYVDVEKDTYNMSPEDLLKKISPRARAVIIQHTFGLPAKIDEILAIAKKNNLLIIEDAAHALGAEYKGKKVGTFADAAIFSFGRFKIISAVFAGAAVTDNPEIARKIEKFFQECHYPPSLWIFKQLFHPVFLFFAKPLYNVFSLGKVMVVLAKKLKLLSLTICSEEKSGGHPDLEPSKMPNALAILGLNQLKKLQKYNKHRRKLAGIYQEQIKTNEKIKFVTALKDTIPVYLYFPLRFSSDALAYKLIGAGRKYEGIYLENWPAKKVIGPQDVNLEKLQYRIGLCSIAENMALKSVVLPTNILTSEKDAKRIVSLVNSFISKNV